MRLCGIDEKMDRDREKRRKKILIATNPNYWDKEDFIKYYVVTLEIYKL